MKANKTNLSPSRILDFLAKRKAFFVALLLSSFFWVATKLSQSLSFTTSVHLDYEFSDSLAIAGELPDHVDVKLESTGWNFLFDNKNHQADNLILNLAQDQYIITPKELKNQLRGIFSPFLYSIQDVTPEKIEYDLLEAHNKRIPIRFNKSIDLAEGYLVKSDFQLSEDSISIYGSKQILKEIDFYQIPNINISDLKGMYSDSVSVKFNYDKTQLKHKPNRIHYLVESEISTEKRITCPVSIPSSIKDSFDIVPSHIELQVLIGLSKYDKINSEDFTLALKNLNNDSKNSSLEFYGLELLKSPDYIKVLNINPQEVQVFKIEKPQ